jgi:hypothetical protein
MSRALESSRRRAAAAALEAGRLRDSVEVSQAAAAEAARALRHGQASSQQQSRREREAAGAVATQLRELKCVRPRSRHD